MSRSKVVPTLLVAVVGLTAARLWLAGRTELLPEEAYYWMYAQHPAGGYYDHPPMVAWIIGAGTWLLGNTERGVRLVNVLLWVCSCLTLHRTARLWFDERVAGWAAWLFVVLPIFLGAGFIVTPDGVMIFFWALTLCAVTSAVQTQRSRYWFLAGAAFGSALLSKYYALLLAPSLLLFLALSPRYRSWLRRWQPWAAGVVALLVFSPVIVWNAQHAWASFAFQSARTVGQRGGALPKVAVFWLWQLIVLTPVGLALFAAAAAQGIRRGWFERDDAWNFATSFSLPVFALFCAASFKTAVHINWTAPAFLSLTPAAAALFLENANAVAPGRRRVWRAGVWTLGIIGLATMALGHFALATGQSMSFAYSRAGDWRELAARVEVSRQALARETGLEPFVIGADKYNIAAEMGFYLGLPDECMNLFPVGGEGMSFRFWSDLRRFEGRPAIAVILNPTDRTMANLRKHFERVGPPDPVAIGIWKNGALVACYQYRRLANP